MDTVGWPLDVNIIRGKTRDKQEANTFGMVRHYANGTDKPHQGWDFLAENGTDCFAVADGVVKLIYRSQDYGLVLVQSFQFNGHNLFAAYAHLSSTVAAVGESIKRGELICRTGSSGNAGNMPPGERHLHFEVRTVPRPGLGLSGRISPWSIFAKAPWTAINRA